MKGVWKIKVIVVGSRNIFFRYVDDLSFNGDQIEAKNRMIIDR